MQKIILGLTTLLAVTAAKADVAVKNVNCEQQLNIHHPPGSSGLYFDVDCKTAYVLPPSQSVVGISALTPTSMIKQCRVVNAMLDYVGDEADQLKAASKPSSPRSGPDQNGLIDGILNPPAPTHIDTPAERQAKMDLFNDVMDLQDKLAQSVDKFKNIQAAQAQITFSIPWGALVEEYQNINRIAGLKFERMPLDSAYLTFDREISGIGNAPAVLKYAVTGVNGNAAGFNDATPGTDTQTTLLAGDAFSGQIVLSLFGACPYYDAASDSLSLANQKQSMTALLNVNLNYSYGLQVYRKYHVEYNLDLLVKHIHDSESHGGFFNTSSSVTETNSTDITDWFSIKNESNDSRFSYELDIPGLKAEAINRAISDVAMAQGKNPQDLPMVAIRNKDGAQATAEVLQKCPNVYCQAGALALEALDAIFGSSSAVSTYTDSKTAVVKEDIADNKTYRFFGTSSFVSSKPVFTFGN